MSKITNRNIVTDFLQGNEAIARACIDSNIGYATGYPGTPSSDILNYLTGISKDRDILIEWATNEMVSFENAVGATLSGKRALVTMKHAGLNWVADPLSVAVYSGVHTGLVILSADDPGCHSSANEQDSRFYGQFFNILTLEPQDPQEAYLMTAEAFELSEKTELPVLVRSVTRVSHARSNVTYKATKNDLSPLSKIEIDPERFIITGHRTLTRHRWQMNQLRLIKEISDQTDYNLTEGNQDADLAILTSGVAYGYVKDALKLVPGADPNVIKIGCPYPIPDNFILQALANNNSVLVIEEGASIVEMQLKALVGEHHLKCQIFGKTNGVIDPVGELNVDRIVEAIDQVVNHKQRRIPKPTDIKVQSKDLLLDRSSVFCAGCPHTGTTYALRQVFKKNKVNPFVGLDIGCYTLMCFEPHRVGSAKYSMGASISLASGYAKMSGEKAVAVIGDSTFFHSGLPGLINCVSNPCDVTVIICDNSITAMTGGQANPATGVTAQGKSTQPVDLEELVHGCGIQCVEVTDSFNVKDTEAAIKRAFEFEGPSVVISKGSCALQAGKELIRKGLNWPDYSVDTKACNNCGKCMRQTACPAMRAMEDSMVIDSSACTGCGVCSYICPTQAINATVE